MTLTEQLNGPPPAAIAALGEPALRALADLMEEAEARQRQELTDALEHALRVVPRPLRPVIRKVVGA